MVKHYADLIEKEKNDFMDWDFTEAHTKELTHGFHKYPAMMIPQIARRLIRLYGKNAKTLLDPFCGSGTSLVEASLNDQIKEAHGFDLNPLSILMSKAKTTTFNLDDAKKALNAVLASDQRCDAPEFKNVNFWFKPQVVEKLAILKNEIEKIQNKNVKNFFLVAFSETVRNVSNTRNNEFKLYRLPEKSLAKHDPDVLEEFKKTFLRNFYRLEKYLKSKKKTIIKAKLKNSMKALPLKQGSIDLVVTSPPYGDSKTTVAYGQFSRLSLQWLGFEDVSSLDNELLGGASSKKLKVDLKSPTLTKTIKKISKQDEKRSREILTFYQDFDNCVDQINKAMAKKGRVCFVVGNRTVKGITIPTHKIMIELFMAKDDYKHIATHLRNIPNKRMPSLNSPTNEKGKTAKTINNEFIFVLQKI